jgi:helix-turn-helix protein
MEQPVLVVPPELIEALVARVVERLPLPLAGEPWVGVAEVARHLGCRPQRVYDLVSRRATSGIPHRKEGGRLLFRLSQIDAWIESGRASAC